ncbi:hypothetical protein ACHAW6_000010 [Cyclotella cf. meneghiniana]
MLSIIAILKEFYDVLLGADLHVFTDHKNLTSDILKTPCVLHRCNKVEEFSPMLHCIQGPLIFWLITYLISNIGSDHRREESSRPSSSF